jgi:hypothetical protein
MPENKTITLNPGDTLTITVPSDFTQSNNNNNINNNIVKVPYIEPLEGGKRKNRTRKQEGGKKPLSGFMKFCKEQRPNIMKENPGIEFTKVGKKLGEKWRALSDSEKSKY